MRGTGTQSDPFIVETSPDFIDAVKVGNVGKYVKLANDISIETQQTVSIYSREVDLDANKITLLASSIGAIPAIQTFITTDIKNGALDVTADLVNAPTIMGSNNNVTTFESCVIKMHTNGNASAPIFYNISFSTCEITIDGGSFGSVPIIMPFNLHSSCMILQNAVIGEIVFSPFGNSSVSCENSYFAVDSTTEESQISMTAPETDKVALWATSSESSFTANGWTKCSVNEIKNPEFTSGHGLTEWMYNSNVNNGYPYIIKRGLEPFPEPDNRIYMRNQICIYDVDTPKNGFNNNGLAVLAPSSCTIREKMNDEYSLSMEHPIDEDGIWRTISAFTHIKALGQIFDVKTVTHDYAGRSGKINVYAEHVSYKMNDPWIFPESVISGSTSNELIQSAMAAADAVPFPGSVDYTFSYDSDIPVTAGYTRTIDKGCTLAEAIIGSGGIQETFGGELYRDNFYFSLKQRMEGSLDNAFEIRVGLNMKGIKRTVDVETFCSYFRAYDHLGQWFAISYDASAYSGLPIQNSVVRSQNFSYDTDDPAVSMANLEREADFYWWKHLAPKITYEVDLRDTRNNPDFAFIYNPYRFKVGDYGRIYDDRLGGALELRITETETDALTGEVTKVVFGDLRGFVKESGQLPLPEFPEIPPKPLYDETKIAILPLDTETLQPTGAIYYFGNFQDAKSWLYDRSGSGVLYHVRIGSEMGIDSIPEAALGGCINIFRLTIPEGIETIGVRAFEGCSALSTLHMPYRMLTVSERAFYQCVGLTEVYLSRNLRSIGYESFTSCQNLKSIVIPANVETVGSGAFSSCTSLDNIVIENGVQSIMGSAFSGCNATSIEVPKSITEIRSNAFNTTSIRNITIDKPQDSISGAPWGAINAQVIWTG